MQTRTKRNRGRFLPSLFIGDLIVLVLFNAHGMASHQTISGFSSIIVTSAPILIAWIAIGLWLGVFWERAVTSVGAALRSVILPWLLAVPIAMQLRMLLLQRGAPLIFAAVFFTGGTVYFMVWRILYTLVSGKFRRS